MFRILNLFLLVGALTIARAEIISSPDGTLCVDVSVLGTRLSYSVRHDSNVVIQTSPLGFMLGGADLGEDVAISSSDADDVDETFPSRHGVHTDVINRYHGKRITVKHKPGGIPYVLNVRAFDSGIAFRFELSHSGAKQVTSEATSFILPERTWIWSQRGTGVYEDIYTGADINTVPAGTAMGPPVVARLPDSSGYVAITQSAPGVGFPNPFIVKSEGHGGRALQVTYPKNADGGHGASVEGSAFTPWNVVMVGDSLNDLVNSDIVESLAPAPDPALFPDGPATSWARPGRSVWDWMARFPGGITAENAKLNSYWANQLGWEYNTIDEGWGKWNNGDPWQKVREITAHADPLGVRILLWVRSSNLKTRELRTGFFEKLKSAGASGFKADFFDFDSVSPAAGERMELVDAILREAAVYHLVADLHGTGKPVGQFRTYPNLLNVESVFGKEQFPKAAASVYPPFTRLLAGPADYTPVGLDDKLRGTQTAAFEIATFINMAGPLVTLSERSDTMAKSPFAPLLRGIPCMWDETVVLQGSEIGESCVMARRKGEMWMAAVMNANAPRAISLPLDFLRGGTIYQAEIIRDASQVIEYRIVTRETKLDLAVAAGGGFVARFTALPANVVSVLPFITNFGTGRGSVYAENGRVLSNDTWGNRLLVDRLPDRMGSTSCQGSSLTSEIDYSDPYQAGSSLRIHGTLDAVIDLPLFQTNLAVSERTRLSLPFKRGKTAADSAIRVGLRFADTDQAPVFLDAVGAPRDSWSLLQAELKAHAGRRITGVFLRFSSESAISGYEARIGGLAIYDSPFSATRAPSNLRAEQVTFTGLDSMDAVLKWDRPDGMIILHRIYQKNPLTGQLVWMGTTSGNSFDLLNAVRFDGEREAVIEVAAVGENHAASAHVAVSIALPQRPSPESKLAGRVIGTEGVFDKSAGMREAVYDNNVSTYFDAAAADGVWAGLDLGAARSSRVTAICYFPRDQWSERMVGGRFEGANQIDFRDAVTLAKVEASPRAGRFTLLEVTDTRTFRYLRYLSPNGGWGNVAEVQFFGSPGQNDRSY